MKKLWFYIVCWKHRKYTRFEMFEQYVLILKAARRCAYDLGHASSEIKHNDNFGSDFYWEQHEGWLDIFSPTGAKDYRHKLHQQIDNREYEIERLKKLCVKNGIDPEDPDAIPF